MSWAPFQLAALEFPPKKLFGNRDERMVAERRNHLEARHFIIFILFAQITTNCRNTRSLYETVFLRPESDFCCSLVSCSVIWGTCSGWCCRRPALLSESTQTAVSTCPNTPFVSSRHSSRRASSSTAATAPADSWLCSVRGRCSAQMFSRYQNKKLLGAFSSGLILGESPQ